MRETNPATGSESGTILVTVVAAILLLGGLSATMLMRSTHSQKSTRTRADNTRLLFVAEAGIDYNFVRMKADIVYAVKDASAFTWVAADGVYRSEVLDLDAGGLNVQKFQIDLQYQEAGAAVEFADRANPIEPFSEILVTSTAISARTQRTVAVWYGYTMEKAFHGAIISDKLPTGTASAGASLGNAPYGHIVLDGDKERGQQAVFGALRANGSIMFDDDGDTVMLTQSTAATYLGGFDLSKIDAGLAGTPEEIPDFTVPGGANQLFSFDRMEAAAAAGAGQVYNNLAAFAAGMNAANTTSSNLEGFTVVHVDPSTEGSDPRLKQGSASGNDHSIPGGVNITGTLIFRFASGADPMYRIYFETPLNINGADLSAWNAADGSTYTTGFPGTYADPDKKPVAVDIGPTWSNFSAEDDVPALMFDNCVLSIRATCNICGVVYSPSFIEVKNLDNVVQYFNGSIFVGGGIYFRGAGLVGGAMQAVRYDPNTTDNLVTMGGKGQTLTRTGYAVLR